MCVRCAKSKWSTAKAHHYTTHVSDRMRKKDDEKKNEGVNEKAEKWKIILYSKKASFFFSFQLLICVFEVRKKRFTNKVCRTSFTSKPWEAGRTVFFCTCWGCCYYYCCCFCVIVDFFHKLKDRFWCSSFQFLKRLSNLMTSQRWRVHFPRGHWPAKVKERHRNVCVCVCTHCWSSSSLSLFLSSSKCEVIKSLCVYIWWC